MKPDIRMSPAARLSAHDRSSLLRLIACSLFTLLFCFTANAQYRAGLQGIVTDPDGAVVPDAKVTVTSNETNISHTTKTGGGGAYAITGLAPGSYRVTVEKAGFSKKVLSDVVVRAEQLQSLNVELAVGEVSQSVTVSEATVPLIDSESAEIRGTITHKDIEDLPSFGRDPFKLLRITPGVFGDGAQGAGGGNTSMPGVNRPGAGGSESIFFIENGPQIIANGTRQNSNNIQVDGVGLNSVVWGGSAVLTPNEESIKEVQVVANNYSAENGRNSGAQISVISQNGTNQFHGSGFFKWHRPGLNAYQRWNGPGTPSPVTRDNKRFNQYGGSVGGPVLKNKLFFFFSYEGLRNRSNDTKLQWFETPQFRQLAQRTGSLATKMLSFPGVAPLPGTISTLTCAQVGLPATQCRDVAGGLDLGSPLTTPLGTPDPTVNTAGRPWGVGNGLDGIPDVIRLLTPSPSTNRDAQYNGRMDFHPTDKDLLAFSVYWVPTTAHSINGPARTLDQWNSDRLSRSWTAIWDRTFSSTVINEARFSLSGWKFDETKTNSQEPWGLAVANIDTAGSGVMVQRFGAPNPGLFNQSFWTAHDTLSKSYGNHLFKMGGDFSRARFVDASPGAARPTFAFRNLWSYANDAPYQESGNFDPRTGAPSDNRKILHYKITAFFFQDDWKFRPNLTLNLGLRWEYYSPLTAEHGLISTPVLGAGPAVLTGLRIRTGGGLTSTSKQNFGPQLGFAWSPNRLIGHQFDNRLVLRGGFGIGYNVQQLATLSNGRSNPPFITNLTLTAGNVLYKAPSDPFQFVYPANPAALQTFDPNTGLPIGVAPVNLTGFPASEDTPTTYRYSLDAQYNLGRNWVATIGYQGSQTRHYQRQTDLRLVYFPSRNPSVNKLSYYPNDAAAHYNALLSQVSHKFSTQFSIDAQYRYSKTTDQGSQDFYIDQYPFSLDFYNGPSDFDVKHDLKLWGVFTPTIFRGSRGWLEKVVGGWTLSGIMDIHSGFPWTPTVNSNSDLVYMGSGYRALRPLLYRGGAGHDYSNSTFMRTGGNFPNGPLAYFVPSPLPAGSIPPAPGVGRNTFRGPRYFGLDATIAKAFGLPKMPVLGEAARLNLQLNAYNVFNKLNLNPAPDTVISRNGTANPLFGQSQGAFAGRIVEIQARFSF